MSFDPKSATTGEMEAWRAAQKQAIDIVRRAERRAAENVVRAEAAKSSMAIWYEGAKDGAGALLINLELMEPEASP
jgi:hypothetical protein